MGRTYDSIPDDKIAWIQKQEVFWVATAPLSGDGHVNASPKGLRGSFHIENPTRVWYEDLSGSGCETIAHIRENGRITILFNAFEGSPDIVRLYGIGKVYELGTPEYDAYITDRLPGSRAVIVIDVHRVGTSCGWGIPFYKFEGHRRLLLDYARSLENKDKRFGESTAGASSFSPSDKNDDTGVAQGGMKDWWRRMNALSIDGLPAVARAGFVDRPMGGVVPDPEKMGFKQRGVLAPSCSNKSTSASSESTSGDVKQLRINDGSGNAKLVTGLIIGFLASFVLSDLIAVGRKFVMAV